MDQEEFIEEEFMRSITENLMITGSGLMDFVSKIENFNQLLPNEYEYVDHMLRIIPFDTMDQFTKQQWKSEMKAEYLRSEGNERYMKKKFLRALNYYTKCIAFAPLTSTELGMGYANRSAVLFEGRYFKECLEDIDRALKSNYPADKMSKLLTRKEKAENELASTKTFQYHDNPPELLNPNPKIHAAADSVEIAQNARWGRYVVATRDIKAGEIISVEKPYAKTVKRKARGIHCNECLELCYNLIPCDNCSEGLYCNEECRTIAWEKYHKYECEVIRTLSFINCTDPREALLLRLTIQGLEEYDTLKTVEDSDIYRSDRYKEVYNLCTNKDRLEPDDWLKNAYRSALFYKALIDKTDILSKITDNISIAKKKNILKEILLRNSLIIASNASGVNKFDEENFDCPCIGCGIYSFKSLFNHACNQNVDAAEYGDTLVLYAHCNIKKGEQCFANYGESFVVRVKPERAEKLKAYHFTCTCKACKKNWLTKPLLERFDTGFRYLPAVEQLERRFDNGHIKEEDKQEFLKDCFELVERLKQNEGTINRATLRFLIQSCIFSLSNKSLKF